MSTNDPKPNPNKQSPPPPSYVEGELTNEELRQVSGGGGVGNNVKAKPQQQVAIQHADG